VDLDALVKFLGTGGKVHTAPTGRIVLDGGALPADEH
jgi:hypothetical protein